MDQKRPWTQRLADDVGQRIAFYRERQKVSAQELADRCEALGVPSITRTVITKLENQRRDAVSTAEVQVLAYALGVPPAMLLFPLGDAETAEVLPGKYADPLEAIYWFSGAHRLLEPDANGFMEGETIPVLGPEAADLTTLADMTLFRLHEVMAGTAVRDRIQLGDRWDAEDTPDLPEEAKARAHLRISASNLLYIRSEIRRRGLTPRRLPTELDGMAELEDGADG